MSQDKLRVFIPTKVIDKAVSIHNENTEEDVHITSSQLIEYILECWTKPVNEDTQTFLPLVYNGIVIIGNMINDTAVYPYITVPASYDESDLDKDSFEIFDLEESAIYVP